jgi:hypothetical protein
MLKTATLLAALLSAASALPAAAQPAAQCPECRAVLQFRNCDKPLDGKTVFKATITSVTQANCSQVLSLDVPRAAELGLPPVVQVSVGFCAFWAGAIGDAIDVALREPHSLEKSSYTLACRRW